MADDCKEQRALGMFLTRAEMKALTGTSVRKHQIAWLRQQHGLRFWINRRGYPVVARSAIDGTPAATRGEQNASTSWRPAVLHS